MPLAPAAYGPDNNIFFNGTADYTLSGLWAFEQTPIIPGGIGFDPNASYNTGGNWNNSGNWNNFGDWNFNGPFNVATSPSNNLLISNYGGPFPPPPAGDFYLLAENNLFLITHNGTILLSTSNGNDIQLFASDPNATLQMSGNDWVTISSTGLPTSFIEFVPTTEVRITNGNLRIAVGQFEIDNFQGGAPGGSLPVLWDPISKQFYHS